MKYRLFPALNFAWIAALLTIPILSAEESADSLRAHTIAPAVTVTWDYVTLEKKAQDEHPVLREKRMNIEKAEQKLRELEMSAILPKFQVSTGIGPAPGLRPVLDTTTLTLPSTGEAIAQYQKEFDFTEWGPFYGIEMTVAQPLNIGRYRAGHNAASRQIKVSEAEFQKERMDVSEETQRLYFTRVYAGTMLSFLNDASRDMDKAQKKMEQMLDDGDKEVKQTDLLELKAGRYALEKAKHDAALGVSRTDLGIRFLVQVPDSAALATRDTILVMRSEALPSLDSLKLLTLRYHPDLKRLSNGLEARKELLRVAQGEIGPDIFLFGNFKYSKAWSSDRQSGGNDPFARDPLNDITGVGGLGMRLNLNFWERYEKYRKERIELRQLQQTETYAARGLLLKLQDEYAQMLKAKADFIESQKSSRAAEAWLKAVAMKYDLDPSAAKDMLSPYRAALSAKRDYFQAILDYDIAVSKVINAVGWTLSDYFRNLHGEDNKE